MKTFTVQVRGVSKKIEGPDDATQEEAQAEAERQHGVTRERPKAPAHKTRRKR